MFGNLEWCNASNNQKHAYKTGLHIRNTIRMKQMTEKSKNKTKKKVIQYDLKGNLLNEYESLNEAELKTNVKYQHISSCCRGKQKTAGGFKWRYKEENNNGI